MSKDSKVTISKKLEEAANSKNDDKGRRKTPIILAAVVALIIAFMGFYAFASSNSSSDPKNPEKTSSTSEGAPKKVQRSVSGKTLDQDKKDAMKAATGIFNDTKANPNESYEVRLRRLEQGDMSDVPKSLKDRIHLTGAFSTDKELQITLYQSLFTLSTVIGGTEGNEIKPGSSEAWKSVQVDQELGIAYVPITAYAGRDVSFSFEMVYVDGKWKIAPYTLIEAIKMSSAMKNGGSGGS